MNTLKTAVFWTAYIGITVGLVVWLVIAIQNGQLMESQPDTIGWIALVVFLTIAALIATYLGYRYVQARRFKASLKRIRDHNWEHVPDCEEEEEEE